MKSALRSPFDFNQAFIRFHAYLVIFSPSHFSLCHLQWGQQYVGISLSLCITLLTLGSSGNYRDTIKMTLKRIHREITDLQKEDLGNITLGPKDMDNPFLWHARIPGPEGSVYEGGVFEVEIQLATDYPCVLLRQSQVWPLLNTSLRYLIRFSAPKILFLTRLVLQP